MDELMVKRINELAKKSKTTGLTAEEKQEQQVLRQRYIQAFRGNLKSTLNSIVIVDADGNKRAITKDR